MLNLENSLIFSNWTISNIWSLLNQSIIAIWKMANFPNYKFYEFFKLDTFWILIFFLICKIIKIPKIRKFWNSSSIRYSAPFAILLIFKFQISAILKFHCSKIWPSPSLSPLPQTLVVQIWYPFSEPYDTNKYDINLQNSPRPWQVPSKFFSMPSWFLLLC